MAVVLVVARPGHSAPAGVAIRSSPAFPAVGLPLRSIAARCLRAVVAEPGWSSLLPGFQPPPGCRSRAVIRLTHARSV